jgi:hypothetical protein
VGGAGGTRIIENQYNSIYSDAMYFDLQFFGWGVGVARGRIIVGNL